MPYTGTPAIVPADELRFLVGDTDNNNPLLTDDEVDYLLAKYTRIECAAYHGAVSIRSKFGGRARKSIGSATLDQGAIVQQIEPIIRDLATKCGVTGVQRIGAPIAGGIDSRRPMSDADFDNPAVVDP